MNDPVVWRGHLNATEEVLASRCRRLVGWGEEPQKVNHSLVCGRNGIDHAWVAKEVFDYPQPGQALAVGRFSGWTLTIFICDRCGFESVVGFERPRGQPPLRELLPVQRSTRPRSI